MCCPYSTRKGSQNLTLVVFRRRKGSGARGAAGRAVMGAVVVVAVVGVVVGVFVSAVAI